MFVSWLRLTHREWLRGRMVLCKARQIPHINTTAPSAPVLDNQFLGDELIRSKCHRLINFIVRCIGLVFGPWSLFVAKRITRPGRQFSWYVKTSESRSGDRAGLITDWFGKGRGEGINQLPSGRKDFDRVRVYPDHTCQISLRVHQPCSTVSSPGLVVH